jgi:O-antigen/teichoic acid export membrane protein
VQTVLLMGGRSSWQLANTGAALAANIGLNLLLVPPLGLPGAAIAWSVSIVMSNVATVVQVRHLMTLRTFSPSSLLTGVVAAACYGGLGLLLRTLFGSTIPVMLLAVVLSTVCYGLYLWRFRSMLQLSELVAALPRLPRPTLRQRSSVLAPMPDPREAP